VAKIKYDVSNVEGGGDFPQPKPGLYTAKIDEVEAGESKAGNKQLRVIIKITKKGEFKGANLFHYVPLDPESPGYFRMKEFTKALGLKEKGTLDTDKMVGKEVLVRVKPDSYEGEYRARVGAVLAPKKDADDDSSDDGDDDDGDDYEEWSVDELKEELKGRGLRVAGKRAVLIGRLRKDDEDDDDPFS
jgi:hypothetical protein